MRKFTQIVVEERKKDSISLLQSEITSYINKVKKILPKDIQDIIVLTNKYGLYSTEDIDNILSANKSQLSALATQYNISIESMNILYKLLKNNKKYIRLLPQYQTSAERAALEDGRLSADDLTIDLTTPAGRNAAAKMYTPIVLKIANQYINSSKLDRPSLISAGMAGLADAIKDYGKNEENGGKKTTFKTYASYRIQQAILNDINANGHDLSGGNSYNTDKYGAAAFDAISLDGLNNNDDDDDDFKQDHLSHLGVNSSDSNNNYEEEEKSWKNIFKLIEDKYSTRDIDIFYRYFGLGPYHGRRHKVKDIAKEYNMSNGNIRGSVINKIIKFLQTNPQAIKLVSKLRDIYTESLLKELIYFDKEYIAEYLYNDSTYILLENMTRWDNKQLLIHTVHTACDRMNIKDAKIIYYCLVKDDDYLVKQIKKNKKLIISFLADVYPMEDMVHKYESELLDYMREIINAGKLLKIDW